METSATGTPPGNRSSERLTVALLAAVVVVAAIFAFSSSKLVPNHWFALFKLVHVLFAVIWVGGGLVLTILALVAQRSNDPRDVTTVARQAAFVGQRVFAPSGAIVLVMGVAMMINTDFGWGKFWIAIGLLGYASSFITGIAVLSPLATKVRDLSIEKGPEHPETVAVIDRILLIARVDVAVLVLVVADMVTKPFS